MLLVLYDFRLFAYSSVSICFLVQHVFVFSLSLPISLPTRRLFLLFCTLLVHCHFLFLVQFAWQLSLIHNGFSTWLSAVVGMLTLIILDAAQKPFILIPVAEGKNPFNFGHITQHHQTKILFYFDDYSRHIHSPQQRNKKQLSRNAIRQLHIDANDSFVCCINYSPNYREMGPRGDISPKKRRKSNDKSACIECLRPQMIIYNHPYWMHERW